MNELNSVDDIKTYLAAHAHHAPEDLEHICCYSLPPFAWTEIYVFLALTPTPKDSSIMGYYLPCGDDHTEGAIIVCVESLKNHSRLLETVAHESTHAVLDMLKGASMKDIYAAEELVCCYIGALTSKIFNKFMAREKQTEEEVQYEGNKIGQIFNKCEASAKKKEEEREKEDIQRCPGDPHLNLGLDTQMITGFHKAFTQEDKL